MLVVVVGHGLPDSTITFQNDPPARIGDGGRTVTDHHVEPDPRDPLVGAGRTPPAGRRIAMARWLRERDDPAVDLDSLADRFGVSVQTVRRDLSELEAEGLVRRTFGGALVLDPAPRREPTFHERERDRAPQKQALARHAVTLLARGEGVFLDGSSTVLHVARGLAEDWEGEVATPGLPAVLHLAMLPGVRLTLLGGALQPAAGVVRDAITIAQVGALRFDTAIVSCRALHPQLGACEADPGEAALKRAVMSVARRTVLLVDASKLDGTAAHHVADSAEFAAIVTDDQARPEQIAALRDAGSDVVVVGSGTDPAEDRDRTARPQPFPDVPEESTTG